MPWKNKTEEERKVALIGAGRQARQSYFYGYTPAEKSFMQDLYKPRSRFFEAITIRNDCDWLVNHVEKGQTFETFWHKHGKNLLDPTSAVRERSRGNRRSSERQGSNIIGHSTTVGILPIGFFPGKQMSDLSLSSSNVFLHWLFTYCKAFFQNAEVSPADLSSLTFDS